MRIVYHSVITIILGSPFSIGSDLITIINSRNKPVQTLLFILATVVYACPGWQLPSIIIFIIIMIKNTLGRSLSSLPMTCNQSFCLFPVYNNSLVRSQSIAHHTRTHTHCALLTSTRTTDRTTMMMMDPIQLFIFHFMIHQGEWDPCKPNQSN